MPDIPYNPNPTVAPAGATGVFLNVARNPNAFGEGIAEATQRVGGTLEQAGDRQMQDAILYQRQYNETAVDQGNTAYEAKNRDMLFGPDGFYAKRGQDAMNAMAPTAAQLEQNRQDARAALSNPEQQRMFDYISRNSARRELNQMQGHATTEFKVWQGDTAKGAIQNAINNSATYWNDDQRFAQSVGDIRYQAAKLLQLKGIDPESDAGKAEIQHYMSEAWGSRIHSVMAQNADVAREMFDANADQIDAGHRAVLDQQITSHQYMQMARAESQARQAEAAAEKQMHVTQSANVAQYTADVLKGKPLDMGKVADLIRTQQLPPHAAEFLMTLSNKRAAGPETDRADAVIKLHQTLNDPSVPVEDRMAAISAAARGRQITASTAGTLVDAAYRKDNQADSVVAREARGSIMAAAGVPDGLINISHEDAARKAQAEVEFTNRVRVKGEDPIAVRDDMIPRYMPPGIPPSTWPAPRYGNIRSTDDALKVAGATKAAFDAGQISPEQFATEKANVVRFSQFYQRLDQARAAQVAARAQTAPKSGDKAKLKHVVAGGEGS